MIYIDAKRVIETRIAESMGFDKYKQIMETVRKTDVSTDLDFQRTFNAFYRVRRNAEWRKVYYDLFETVKDSNPPFESIIRTIYEATGNIEASFSSKMLATINPDKPIWDRYVVQNLCLSMKGKTKEDQLECAVDLYAQMVRWYDRFLQTENDAMTALHGILEEKCASLKISSYSNRPKQIFDAACVRTSIIICEKTGTPIEHLYTTKLVRRSETNAKLDDIVGLLYELSDDQIDFVKNYEIGVILIWVTSEEDGYATSSGMMREELISTQEERRAIGIPPH